MEVFREQQKLDRAPAVETCIQWELKVGLHKLTRPKEAADDWVWIVDHVVSKGMHKCFVALGVRMSALAKKGDLTVGLKDVEPFRIVPMKTSNGSLMRAEFEAILEANHGIPPLAIIKDHGSDLRCGGRHFCEAHPGIIDIYDVPHKIARLYEHRLKEDVLWGEFTKKCANFKKQVQLTAYSNVAPPNQRSKARYHNIDVLVDWGTDQLLHYGELSQNAKTKLNWLRAYEEELGYWERLVDTGRICRDFVRKQGLWLGCEEPLGDLLAATPLCSHSEEFVCDLIDFIKEQGDKVPEGKRIIGSSEIVESLFGKHKSIAEKGPKPMGRLILSMASRVGESPTESLVETAFGRIRERDVDEWLAKAFC